MGIGSVTSANSMSGMQMITAGSTDSKIKKYQNEITTAQQQMQKLSSKEELSVTEKTTEREKLQKEISGLNTELKRHQEELRRSQKMEAMMAELQKDKGLTKEEKSEDKIQTKEASSDKTDGKTLPSGRQQPESQGTVIFQNSDGTVIFKGASNQDEKRGVDTEKDQNDEDKKDIAGKETKTEDGGKAADTGLSQKEIRAIVSADASVQQAGRQGAVIAKTRDGTAVLKGEMNQDEKRNVDKEKKQAELEKMEKKEQRAMAFQFSVLGEANQNMKSAEANGTDSKDNTQANVENNGFQNAFMNALNVSQEEQWASQQIFHVSLGH